MNLNESLQRHGNVKFAKNNLRGWLKIQTNNITNNTAIPCDDTFKKGKKNSTKLHTTSPIQYPFVHLEEEVSRLEEPLLPLQSNQVHIILELGPPSLAVQ